MGCAFQLWFSISLANTTIKKVLKLKVRCFWRYYCAISIKNQTLEISPDYFPLVLYIFCTIIFAYFQYIAEPKSGTLADGF